MLVIWASSVFTSMKLLWNSGGFGPLDDSPVISEFRAAVIHCRHRSISLLSTSPTSPRRRFVALQLRIRRRAESWIFSKNMMFPILDVLPLDAQKRICTAKNLFKRTWKFKHLWKTMFHIKVVGNWACLCLQSMAFFSWSQRPFRTEMSGICKDWLILKCHASSNKICMNDFPWNIWNVVFQDISDFESVHLCSFSTSSFRLLLSAEGLENYWSKNHLLRPTPCLEWYHIFW